MVLFSCCRHSMFSAMRLGKDTLLTMMRLTQLNMDHKKAKGYILLVWHTLGRNMLLWIIFYLKARVNTVNMTGKDISIIFSFRNCSKGPILWFSSFTFIYSTRCIYKELNWFLELFNYGFMWPRLTCYMICAWYLSAKFAILS